MKKLFMRLMACILTLCILFTVPAAAGAASTFPDSLYLTQSTSGTCTLCSATMMIRYRMYLSNNSSWSRVTESDVRSYGWLSGVGLMWNWTYTFNDSSITIGRRAVSNGITADELKAILDDHPEGIVLYVTSVPHAVFLTDYEGDTFYCADPSSYYSGKRIPLDASYTASRVGDQAAVLAKVSSYWYVADYSIPVHTESDEIIVPESCTCTEDTVGEYICIASSLNIRSGDGTSYGIVGTIPYGAVVKVSMSDGNWAHVEYNGISGYANINYLTGNRPMGDVDGDYIVSNSDIVNIVRYIVGILDDNSERYEDIIRYGDMNGDGIVTNGDLVTIIGLTIGL